jgi:hypothetical protein
MPEKDKLIDASTFLDQALVVNITPAAMLL